MQSVAESSSRCQPDRYPRGYGATAARLTPDLKARSSNLSGLKFIVSVLRHVGMTTLVSPIVRMEGGQLTRLVRATWNCGQHPVGP